MRARTALAAPVLAATLTSAALLLAACGGTGGSSAGGSGAEPSATSTATATPAAAQSSSGGSGKGVDDKGKDETGKPGGDDKGGAGGGGEDSRVKQRCHTSQLRPSFRAQAGSGGAGQRHALLVLTNTSMTTCTVYGYGGFQLYDANGNKVPTHLVRSGSQGPVTLTVKPGRAIQSQLSWGVVPSGKEDGKRCEPTPRTARVTPPDERDNRTATWEFGAVCGQGKITQGAYRHVTD